MTNIPTELLRTLVAVVDLRSFTKAAQLLGITQPAVSSQIKRLQSLLGSDLFDKRAPGVTLTSAGDLVVNYARRLLSINDQILDLAGPAETAQAFRIGATGDFMAGNIAQAVGSHRTRWPRQRFLVSNGLIDDLLRDLRDGQLDLVVWVSNVGPKIEARHCWKEPLVWVRGPSFRLDPALPVPLVSYGEDCPFTAASVAQLHQAQRDGEIMFMGSSLIALAGAISAGLGVSVLPALCGATAGMSIWHDAPLPALPDLYCGIYVRPGADSAGRDQLADVLAQSLCQQKPNLDARVVAAE